MTSSMWGDLILLKYLHVTKDSFLKKLLDIFSWLWLNNLISLLPFMLWLSIPHGSKVFWYILDLVPRLEFTSCPPLNFSVFGTELIIELRMLMKSVCSNLSTWWYTEATNNVVLPRTFFLYWFIHRNLSFTLINLPTNGESIGVVIGGFDPAALHALTSVGDSIIATPRNSTFGSYGPLFLVVLKEHLSSNKFNTWSCYPCFLDTVNHNVISNH